MGNSEWADHRHRRSIDITRQQYRVALVRQLRVGLEENRQIDLRDAKHEVVVAFADNRSSRLATSRWVVQRSPTSSSHRTTLKWTSHDAVLTEGSRELADSDLFRSSTHLGELVAQLRRDPELMRSPHGRRVNVIDAPASVYHDGLAYSFAFSQLIDVRKHAISSQKRPTESAHSPTRSTRGWPKGFPPTFAVIGRATGQFGSPPSAAFPDKVSSTASFLIPATQRVKVSLDFRRQQSRSGPRDAQANVAGQRRTASPPRLGTDRTGR